MTAAALLIAVLMIALNGFFVAVEFMLVAGRRTRMVELAEAGDRRAAITVSAMDELTVQLAGAQLGITATSLVLGFVAEPALAHLLENLFGVVPGIPEAAAHAVAVIIGLIVVVFAHMVFGEMVPKNIAIAEPERTALWLAVPARIFVTLFRPLIRALNGMANLSMPLFGVGAQDRLSEARTVEELEALLSTSVSAGVLDPEEYDLLAGALGFGSRNVESVMLPWDRVVRVDRSDPVAELEVRIRASGHTRLPVEREDGRIGFLHAKDLLHLPESAQDQPVPDRLVRDPAVLGPDTTLEDALLEMQRRRVHVAVVVDDQGAPAGLVTMEDVVEALVGDIRDETDTGRRRARRAERKGRDSSS